MYNGDWMPSSVLVNALKHGRIFHGSAKAFAEIILTEKEAGLGFFLSLLSPPVIFNGLLRDLMITNLVIGSDGFVGNPVCDCLKAGAQVMPGPRIGSMPITPMQGEVPGWTLNVSLQKELGRMLRRHQRLHKA
ncbi:MAG TPA: hypothetical protein VFB27_11540 [Opitutaceae bacterium]|nr:hypothetical protein [Opitutaceae bacterium]